MNAIKQAVESVLGRDEAPTPVFGPVEACVFELVENAVNAGARTVRIEFAWDADLVVVDDGRGIRVNPFSAFYGEGIRRSVLALGQRPMMRVESTNESQVNSALFDVRMGSSVAHRSRIFGLASPAAQGGLQPRERLKSGTRIEIRGVMQSRAVDAITLEAHCSALHPHVAITVR